MEDYSHEEQVSITRGVLSILEKWGVPAAAQIQILALPVKTKARQMKHFKEETPFPLSPDLVERVTHLIAIAEALRTTYPMNPIAGDIWMRTPHRRFNNHAPLKTILEKGLAGLEEVRGHLDCTYRG